MARQVSYPCTALERAGRVELTGHAVDDYQRCFFLQVGRQEGGGGLLERANRAMSIRTASYRTNSAVQFYDAGAPDAARQGVGAGSRKERRTLECFEYQIPDITQGGETCDGRGWDGLAVEAGNVIKVLEPREAAAPDISFLTKNQQFKLHKMQYSEQAGNVINPNNVILWDYKTGYVFFTGIWRLYQDVMRGMCNLPRGSTRGEEENSQQRQWQCYKELEYSLKACLYEPYGGKARAEGSHRRQRLSSGRTTHTSASNSSSASANTHTSSAVASASSYTDVHWNQVDLAWKQRLCSIYQQEKKLEFTPEFQDCYKRIRGGYIKIQGTWLPMEICKRLCIRFCFPIRYFLVPIFGEGFLQECQDWYFTHRLKQDLCKSTLSPPISEVALPAVETSYTLVTGRSLDYASISPRSTSIPQAALPTVKQESSDTELLDASQNLLDISRRTSLHSEHYVSPNTPPSMLAGPTCNRAIVRQGSERYSLDLNPHPQLQVSQRDGRPIGGYKERSCSWSSSASPLGSVQRQESLPPISTLINSLPNFNPEAGETPTSITPEFKRARHELQGSFSYPRTNYPSQLPLNHICSTFNNVKAPDSLQKPTAYHSFSHLLGMQEQPVHGSNTAQLRSRKIPTDAPAAAGYGSSAPDWATLCAASEALSTFPEGVSIGYNERV
ncbi:AaceriADL227Cp [[Ashbya] aceris (nom. inval.)]|nr:AaceriADL227Cp [[Ashbya] aceris (nom. inval.)]